MYIITKLLYNNNTFSTQLSTGIHVQCRYTSHVLQIHPMITKHLHSHVGVTDVAVAVLNDMIMLCGVEDKSSSSTMKLPAHVGVSRVDGGGDNTSTHMNNEHQTR